MVRGHAVTSEARTKPLSLWERITFAWMGRVVKMARQGKLHMEDLFLPAENMSQTAYQDFQQHWSEEVSLGKNSGQQPNLTRALRKTYAKPYFIAGIFKGLWSVFVITGAFFFVRSLLDHVNGVEGPYQSPKAGWFLVGGFFLDAWFLGMSLQRMAFGSLQCGIKARGALTSAVCQKSFRMNTISQDSAADVVSFVATDINKVFEAMQEFHYLWTAPFEASAIIILLAVMTGRSMLPGLAVILCVVPAQYYFGLKIVSFKMRNSKNIQARSGILTEVLPAIKLVKYYAWEQYFENAVNEVRKREQKINFWNAFIKTVNVSIVFCVPPLTAFVIFTAYEFTGNRLVSTVAFTTLSLFNILRFPLVVLPKALRAVSDGYAAIRRVEGFLLAPVEQGSKSMPAAGGRQGPGVNIINGVFTHPSNANWRLQVPMFSVKPGEVVAVVGRVGAGKSSLIHAVLGNMVREAGTMEASGVVGYVPQNPWMQNLSLRENVTFGESFDQRRYDQVINNCALTLDLEILAHGDQTKAGLRGINFSGGQRQRVNLARCAYGPGELLLLDNAMSAVDHHTANHIFDNLIRGQFSNKAVLLITHQLEFLPRCDNICIMDEGKCLYFGPWNANCGQLLSKLLPINHLLASHEAGEGGAGKAPPARSASSGLKKMNKKNSGMGLSLAPTTLQGDATSSSDSEDERRAPRRPARAIGPDHVTNNGQQAQKKDEQAHKHRHVGRHHRISATKALGLYLKNGGILLWTFAIAMFLLAQASRQVSDFWVRWWTADRFLKYKGDPKSNDARTLYALGYMGIGVGAFWSLMVFRGASFLWAVLGSAEKMRRQMLHKILNAPMGFFLATPVGDLLLNFTKDQEVLDENLPDSLHFMGIYGLILIATTITVSITMNYFAPFAGLLFFTTAVMLSLYLPASTTLKKLRNDTSGNVVSLFAEVLEGLPVIQAFGKQDYFINEAARRIDIFHTALFNAEALNLWLAFVCDFIGAVLVLAVSSFAVGLAETLGAATVGLAFSNTIQMLVFYTWVVRFIAESLSLWGSVENVSWLATFTPEDGAGVIDEHGQVSNGCPVPHLDHHHGHNGASEIFVAGSANAAILHMKDNPEYGRIRFEGVWMQYRAGAPFALKNVSFVANRSEKIGVVGRTGSGKSTLLLALFRMFELGKGRVFVNGCDISAVPLKELRASLSIIPQEPVMFSGSVRSNLDPWNEFSDNQLWDVIRKVGLESQVRDQAGGLDGRVDGTGGKAWSLGQQQLVCLCRAALKETPILCLDEATAAMDPHTENVVQATIKRIFAERTTLTIAHRLDTVIQSDKVVVMEQGVLMEMAHPHTLLSNRESLFAKLIDKSPSAVAAALRKEAHEHYISSGAAAKDAAAKVEGRASRGTPSLLGLGFGASGGLQLQHSDSIQE